MNEIVNINSFKSRLFDKKIINSEEYRTLGFILKVIYDDKYLLERDAINYIDLEDTIIKLGIKIMKNIINNTKYKDDDVSFVVEKMCFGYGSFTGNKNLNKKFNCD